MQKSIVEAEFRAMAETACELLWMRSLISELGFQVKNPIQMHRDNQATIYIASNPMFYERTKPIEVDCHFVLEKVTQGLISTPYAKSNSQFADMFTKALLKGQMDSILDKLGMIEIHAPA